MSGETVSVLIPTYRRPTLLARAIRSVQAQNWRDLRIVVNDNASGDGTAALVANMAREDSRIVYRCHTRNIGAAANFRHAIFNVSTPLFCIVSDDDILLPRCLENSVANLRAYPSAMAWSGIVISATDAGAKRVRPWPPWPAGFASPVVASLRVANDSRPETTGMVFRRAIISNRFLGDRPSFFASDVGWVLEAAKLGGIGHTPEPVAVFYQHAGSLSASAGANHRRAQSIFWPSTRHLIDQFSEDCPLPARSASVCREAIRRTYGIANTRRLAAIALLRGDRLAVSDSGSILMALGDARGLAYLSALSRMPRSTACYALRFGQALARLRRSRQAVCHRYRVATLSALAQQYLRLYA